ncbi:Hpt domain-containing protein [Gracilimonas amylolytica]|uniref:Hpt domain-containing protein n=1 Tax=Gracilimonas amylolytica TaxID=1749045 RepID=UPI000CD861A2|nr:Hpt domain-containing protein [Gracilimonas amylolytica]
MGKIDLSYLENMSGGDNAMIVEMIELFLQETPLHLDNLKEADQNSQWNKVASEAHKIKPIMLYVGLSELNLVCKKIEDNAKGDQDPELSNELIKQLEAGYKDVSGDLETKIEELR